MIRFLRWPARIAIAAALTAGGVVLGDTLLPVVSYFRGGDCEDVAGTGLDAALSLRAIERSVNELRHLNDQDRTQETLSEDLARFDRRIDAVEIAIRALADTDIDAASKLARAKTLLAKQKRITAIGYADRVSSQAEAQADLVRIANDLAQLVGRRLPDRRSKELAHPSNTAFGDQLPMSPSASNERTRP